LFLSEAETFFPEIIGNIFFDKKSKNFSQKNRKLFPEKLETFFQIKYRKFFPEKTPKLFFIQNQNFIPKNNREHFLKKIEKLFRIFRKKRLKNIFSEKTRIFF
jgi:hypothetical protein